MINIVIPMAGRGSRFAVEGYDLPKPLIRVHSEPMISVVVKNLAPKKKHRFIFLCLSEHIEKYSLNSYLSNLSPGSIVVPVSEVTQGAACTVLLAEKYIDNNDHLMIANSDQWIDADINEYIEIMNQDASVDGLIMTMTAHDKKWSYVEMNSKNLVTRVVEKEVISDEATVGIYNFKKGSEFVRAAKNMIKNDLKSNGEFYVAPVYNELINEGARVKIFNIGSEFNGMYGLGIPSDLKKFMEADVSQKIFLNKENM